MTVKELFKILLFLFLFTVILAPLTLVLTNKENSSYMTGFIDEPKDSLDILFVGSSKSYRIIYPLQLWNEQGFVSYNLGSSSQDIPISYYVTKYGIEKQHPDLIVLEVGRAYLSEKSQSDAMLHQVWDNLDFNISEYECIKDVADNKEALFLPIIEYHSRWTDLEAKDFSYDKDNQKGTGTYSYVSRYHYPTIIDKSEKEDLPAVSEEYLLKTIELCKSTNTDLLLVGTPSGYDNELDQKIYHSIQDIADNNNINFINFYDSWDELNLDWQYAFANRGHLNTLSSHEVTSYIGNYIKENYTITDHRNDPEYKDEWNNAYSEYEYLYKIFADNNQSAYEEALNSKYKDTSSSKKNKGDS